MLDLELRSGLGCRHKLLLMMYVYPSSGQNIMSTIIMSVGMSLLYLKLESV